MSNNKQSSVDLLWNLIPKDTQNYIIKQFDGYNKAKTMHKEEIIQAINFADNDPEHSIGEKQYYRETFETLTGEAEE